MFVRVHQIMFLLKIKNVKYFNSPALPQLVIETSCFPFPIINIINNIMSLLLLLSNLGRGPSFPPAAAQ